MDIWHPFGLIVKYCCV